MSGRPRLSWILMQSIPRLREGDSSISAADFNAAFEEIERATRLNVEAPLEMDDDGNGKSIRLAKVFPFWARITGKRSRPTTTGSGSGSGSGESDSGASGESSGDASGDASGSGSGEPEGCLYSWIEQTSSLNPCGMSDAVNGFEGFTDDQPAKEVMGLTIVAVGEIVYLTPSATGDHYLFRAGGSGARVRVELLTGACIVRGAIGSGSGSGSGVEDG